MTEKEILEYITLNIEESFYDTCEPFEVVVNNKNKTVVVRPQNYELQPREKAYLYKRINNSSFLSLSEEY